MKKIIFPLVIMIWSAVPLSGQQKPKSKMKDETPPTASEMEDLMRQAQQEMDNLDPEAKRMMDSMGIKMPSFTDIPKVTDADLRKAYEDENRIVPQRDALRIASIPKAPLTDATLPAYLSRAHSQVVARLTPQSRAKGEEIYNSQKAQYNSAAATGNVAASLFMMGKIQLALYVMGKACQDAPTNTDNLNNYASMLSMSGAEQISIPLLDYVNKRYPNNSTVLNNLGQAWFGLGEIDKANTYLESTIRLCAFHPQANYTKSFIEESKDHGPAAIQAAKNSIKSAYTQSKADRLKKLGHNLDGKDLNWDRPMPADPLGLEKFSWPAYPMKVEEVLHLEKDWDAFKSRSRQELNSLKTTQAKLEKEMMAAEQKRTQQLMSAAQKGLWVDPVPPSALKAIIKLKYLVDDSDGHLSHEYEQKTRKVSDAILAVSDMQKDFELKMQQVRDKYEDKFGEGKPNPFEQACRDENAVTSAFLAQSNTTLENAFADYLNFLRRKINNETYYNQYTMWPEQFEVAKNQAKMTWLTAITDQKVMFNAKSTWCPSTMVVKDKPFKLAAFDDVHCEYHSQLTTPVGTIRTDCSRMTTTLDLKFLKLGLKQDMDKETFGDQFMNCSVEVGAGVGAGVSNGPLKAEAYAGARLAAEFDRNGLTDLAIKTSAGVSAGTDIITGGKMAGVGVSDLSVDVGVQGQISLISGKSSFETTGLLDGAFKQ